MKVKSGDLLKVPFTEGGHTYARILVDDSYAFYDCLSFKDRADYDAIIQSDILFVARVDVFAVKEGYWEVVANILLETPLDSYYPRYFNPAPTSAENINFFKVYQQEIEIAITKDWIKTGKIQLDGVYGGVHIEHRLNDYYNGKTNQANRAVIWLFKKYIGLHVDESKK